MWIYTYIWTYVCHTKACWLGHRYFNIIWVKLCFSLFSNFGNMREKWALIMVFKRNFCLVTSFLIIVLLKLAYKKVRVSNL